MDLDPNDEARMDFLQETLKDMAQSKEYRDLIKATNADFTQFVIKREQKAKPNSGETEPEVRH